jgi:APA family basic amino acid/polyamine antiporter
VADAFKARGLGWIAAVISASAVIGIASVLFAFMLGAARIWFALSRDGLLPGWFAKVHPTYGTPHRPTIVLGVFTAVVAGLFPLGEVAKLVNIGVLSAFIVICASVILLRVRKPDLPRSFRTPLVPLVPLVGIGFSIWLLSELALITWMVFVVWVAIGLVVYFGYGIRHSKLE